MKEYAKNIVKQSSNELQARNKLREYLQVLFLSALQRKGAMISLAFHGGTALRFIYQLPRYSEDLDFTLERKADKFNLEEILKTAQKIFHLQGFETTIKFNLEKTVQNAFLRFPGLLYEMNLSPHQTETLAIKIEVDTNPPTGTVLVTTLVRKYITLQIQHHDQASLLSGKLNAFFTRSFTKGRDLYDLLWYLSDPQWPPPNFKMMNNALRQYNYKGPVLTDQNWKSLLLEKMESVNFDQARKDVAPFLEFQHEIDLLTRENLVRLLKKQVRRSFPF